MRRAACKIHGHAALACWLAVSVELALLSEVQLSAVASPQRGSQSSVTPVDAGNYTENALNGSGIRSFRQQPRRYDPLTWTKQETFGQQNSSEQTNLPSIAAAVEREVDGKCTGRLTGTWRRTRLGAAQPKPHAGAAPAASAVTSVRAAAAAAHSTYAGHAAHTTRSMGASAGDTAPAADPEAQQPGAGANPRHSSGATSRIGRQRGTYTHGPPSVHGAVRRLLRLPPLVRGPPGVKVELWDYVPGPGECDFHNLSLGPVVDKLAGRRVVFVGDSLTRNMANAVLDVLQFDRCNASDRKMVMVNGRVVDPRATWNACRQRPAGQQDGEQLALRQGFSLQFLWNPRYPDWTYPNCTQELWERDLWNVGRRPGYFHVQLQRNCATLRSLLAEVLADEAALAVISYPVIHVWEDEPDTFMLRTLPDLLASPPFAGRVLFFSHERVPKVQRFLNELERRRIPFISYPDIAPQLPFFYDRMHQSGAVQGVVAKGLLWALANELS